MTVKTVLIVDDNPLNIKLVVFLLTAKGYAVYTSANAEETLNFLEKTTPDLILMDIQLPGMNGLELTEKLKADLRYKSIPIIAITAYAMEGDKEKALSAGCDDYITKPIDTRALPDIIAKYININKKD